MNRNTVIRIAIPLSLYESVKGKVLNEGFDNRTPLDKAWHILKELVNELEVEEGDILDYIIQNIMSGPEAEQTMKRVYKNWTGKEYGATKDSLKEEFINPRQKAFGILQTMQELGISEEKILEYVLGNYMNGSDAEDAMKWAYKEFVGNFEDDEEDLEEAKTVHISSKDKFKVNLDGKEWTAKYHNHEKGDKIELASGEETKSGKVTNVSPDGDLTIELNEAKKKPSAGLTKKEKSTISKKAAAGKDIGKKGKGFAAIEKKAKESGADNPKAVAAAAMWKAQAGKKK